VVERRRPRAIAVNVSREHALADGLTKAEHDAMAAALGPEWTARLRPAGALAVDLLAARSADESRFYAELARLTWELVDTMFSRAVITPGTTRASDVVWWYRQRVADLGLATWFQPSVTVQRRGAAAAALGADPVILPGDVLHCDVGLAALGLHTDVQHMAYVPRPGETAVPAGLARALAASSRLQEIVVAELRPGRTGNEVLAAARARMRAEGIDGTVYSHPIGLHGHGAGALVGLWDRQEGVPGRGDHRIMPGMWYSIELQATSAVPEWGGQRVRAGQEEDLVLEADGTARWAWRRQTDWRIVR
jgi:Xaa-Pro aminopeptidase